VFERRGCDQSVDRGDGLVRRQAAPAVRAGSRNDPSDSTGMAHYLEHMFFKGSEKLGTLDYAQEKPHLDVIRLADLAEQGGADAILGAGDYCMDGPRPREVLERLEEIGCGALG